MESSIQKAAERRLQRAWREASYLYERRGDKKKKLLIKTAGKYKKVVENINNIFENMGENPCAKCKRCCSGGAMSIGFHSHNERQMLLSLGVDINQYIVKTWEHEPEARCLFLSKNGCNIPANFRSSHCLKYVCYDKLGPEILKAGVAKQYEKQIESIDKVSEKIVKLLPRLPFENISSNFGEG